MRTAAAWVLALVAWGAAAQTPGDKNWVKLEKAISRGDETAPFRAMHDYGEASLPLLLSALKGRNPVMREKAADEVRDYAYEHEDSAAWRAAMPQLLDALSDPDAAVAMSIAGALSALGESDATLAPARRVVLASPESRAYVRFNAARGLIGIDPDILLLPDLLAFLIESVEEGNTGTWDVQYGIVENHDLAMEALTRLVARGDRRLAAPLMGELDTAHPVVPSIMRVLAHFDPDPDGWATTLVRLSRSPGDNVRAAAWDLMGEAVTPDQIKVWLPAAIAALDRPSERAPALQAIGDLRGRTAQGLDKVAALLTDRSLDAKLRISAAEVLYDASDENLSKGDAAAKAAARPIAQRAYLEVLSTEPEGELAEEVRDKVNWVGLDDRGWAELALTAAERNPDPKAQAALLGKIANAGDRARPLLSRVRAFTEAGDAAVREAATDAMDSLDAAWRARDAHAAAPVAASPAPAGGGIAIRSKSAAQTLLKQRGYSAGMMGVYEAVQKGDAEGLAALIDAGLPINQAAKLSPDVAWTVTPLQVVVDYCHVEQVLPKGALLAMTRALLARGADPALRGSRDRGALETAVDMQCAKELIDLLVAGR